MKRVERTFSNSDPNNYRLLISFSTSPSHLFAMLVPREMACICEGCCSSCLNFHSWCSQLGGALVFSGRSHHKDVEHGLHVKLGGIRSSYPSSLPRQHFKRPTLTLRNMHESQLMAQSLVEPREECSSHAVCWSSVSCTFESRRL